MKNERRSVKMTMIRQYWKITEVATMTRKNLDANVNFVETNRGKLLEEYQNKYILVFNEEVVSSFDTYESAASEGIRLFGLEAPFLVHHLVKKPPFNFIMGALQ